ncbi:hypothetical protein GE09DRAFT_1144878 [Coniochaeta sp. 2T2.1]|nr:hypothetical protein GE09DRAFT_1144878 [Coniochaeta sp. 2T2.1]
MAPLELVIDPESTWEPQKGFLGLPRELRNEIYNLVLIETPKWERRHSPLCDLCPRVTTIFERPVFDVDDATCKCKKRQNAGLLRTNRQIHYETAPIFWSRNTFCFTGAKDFTYNNCNVLRHEYLPLIQYVSILAVSWQEYQWPWFYRGDRRQGRYMCSHSVWPFLSVLEGLKTLEIVPEYIYRPSDSTANEDDDDRYDHTRLVTHIREEMPLLEEFSLAKIIVYDVNPKTSIINPPNHWWKSAKAQDRDLVYVKAKRALDLGKLTTEKEVKEQLRAFNTNFAVHVSFEVETKLLGIAENAFSTNPSQPYADGYRLREGFDDHNTSADLRLRDGTTATVKLLGLPITQWTRIANVKERWREDARRKAAGKPSKWQEKHNTVMQEKQEAKRAQRGEEASKEYQAYVEAKDAKREAAEARERRQRRKVKAKEQAGLARSERQAKETRDAERKRVRRPK